MKKKKKSNKLKEMLRKKKSPTVIYKAHGFTQKVHNWGKGE